MQDRVRRGIMHLLSRHCMSSLECRHMTSCCTCTGILLAVTIIYQYFETYEKEKAQSASLW